MKINCSAGRGLLELEECLQCALEGRNDCGYDYALIKSMMNDKKKESRRSEIHVTDLTGCLRKAWYDKVSPQPEYIHETLARWLGVNFHHAVEGSDDMLDSELPLQDDGLVGTADIVYKDGRIVDLKQTRWIYPQKLPYGSHATQVNLYAHLLRRMGREVTKLQIQYVDASGPTKCRKCKVPVRAYDGILKCPNCENIIANAHLGAVLVDIPLWSEEEVEAYITERKENLLGALELGLPPEKEPGFLCAYCGAVEICQPGEYE
ncbi:MAG: PD-(D/E)XK nuclease family protein [Anaerolineaceae bacterium]